ncbi:sugar phosphate isomerase/epimerase [Paenibacillus endophyticus]|uniref:Sugar phosphate isomerase/epimerase n=1 Tax=Paenibacillus endophyticus TaxID=1294268 RepID=A0A7W5G8R6_9BACL|nr:sugar phosphate isomerase/epimerase [Paenibacillus endophyticus]MBB3151359.1 sugar phosphate isomerase/epimerase [Paenibacillus endophyticus]
MMNNWRNKLLVEMSWWGMEGLAGTAGYAATTEEKIKRIAENGFDGINAFVPSSDDSQLWKEKLEQYGLSFSVNAYPASTADMSAFIEKAIQFGSVDYINVQVMKPFLTGEQALELLSGIDALSRHAGIPIFIETHRGTITQDLIRTRQFLEALPELRLTIDYSHYVVAGELHTISSEAEEMLQSLLPHAGSIHTRISNGEQVQIDPGEAGEHPMLPHFARWWEEAMDQWRAAERRESDRFPVVIELGPAPYAITRDEAGARREELGDRWSQALYLKQLVRQLWQKGLQ